MALAQVYLDKWHLGHDCRKLRQWLELTNE